MNTARKQHLSGMGCFPLSGTPFLRINKALAADFGIQMLFREG